MNTICADKMPEDMRGIPSRLCRLHWEKSNRDEMVELQKDSGYGKSKAFYRVAQAISETLPNESKEKKRLDGFLAGKERLREEITKESSMPKQKKLL